MAFNETDGWTSLATGSYPYGMVVSMTFQGNTPVYGGWVMGNSGYTLPAYWVGSTLHLCNPATSPYETVYSYGSRVASITVSGNNIIAVGYDVSGPSSGQSVSVGGADRGGTPAGVLVYRHQVSRP